jgi:hypothetical protein
MSASDEAGFLSRWARRKADARRGIASPTDAPPATPTGASGVATGGEPVPPPHRVILGTSAGAVPAGDAASAPPPTLEDVANLTRESDYARFVAGDVDPGVRNAAMKKLFTDPLFNRMDGLDVYIDDYGKPDPLPPGMLRKLAQSRFLGLFDESPQEGGAAGDASAPAAPAAVTHANHDTTDEDPDLRLQSDDAPGGELHRPDRAGAGEDPAGQR